MKKAIRKWTAVLATATCFVLYGCSVDVDEDSRETHNKIIGTWEVINIIEKEVMTYSNGQEEVILDEERNIKQTDEDYNVLKFDEASICIKATGDRELANYIDIPISYSISDGNQLRSLLLAGDYTDVCTIQELTNNRLVLYQEDIGYDENNNQSADYMTITFRKVNESITFVDLEYRELIQTLNGNWEATHITEKETLTSRNGQVEILKDVDEDITQENVNYQLLNFGYFNVKMLATGNPEMGDKTGKPYSYIVMNSNQLYCVLLQGEFTDYCTIDEITDSKLVLTLNDKGTNQNKELYENHKTVTYKKVSADQTTKE